MMFQSDKKHKNKKSKEKDKDKSSKSEKKHKKRSREESSSHRDELEEFLNGSISPTADSAYEAIQHMPILIKYKYVMQPQLPH